MVTRGVANAAEAHQRVRKLRADLKKQWSDAAGLVRDYDDKQDEDKNDCCATLPPQSASRLLQLANVCKRAHITVSSKMKRLLLLQAEDEMAKFAASRMRNRRKLIEEEEEKDRLDDAARTKKAGVIALGGGKGMILPQEDLATTTKEEGAEAATALGMATVVKGDDAIGDCSCKAALVEENPKEEIGPWPADVNIFF